MNTPPSSPVMPACLPRTIRVCPGAPLRPESRPVMNDVDMYQPVRLMFDAASINEAEELAMLARLSGLQF